MVPKPKRGDAGNSDMPKRSCKVLPLIEKVESSLNKERTKKSYAEVAKIYGENESSIHEIVKQEKETCYFAGTSNCRSYSHNT